MSDKYQPTPEDSAERDQDNFVDQDESIFDDEAPVDDDWFDEEEPYSELDFDENLDDRYGDPQPDPRNL